MLRKLSLLTLLSLSLCSGAWSQNGGSSSTPAREAVATIAGQTIYEDEVLPLISGQLDKLRQQEYDLKSRGLAALVNQKVLEIEAKKKEIAPEKLLEQEVDSKVADPTDSEIESFYFGHQDQLKRPLAEVRSQIRDGLKRAKLFKARQEYLESLWQDAGVSILMPPPRMEMAYDPARVRGNPKAPITIVEFSDFQCPFCRKSYPIIKDLLTKYEGQIKLAYRDFPLREIHPQAESAAEASRCANEQGKFWEYHDLLFTNPDKLDHAGLVEHARALQLDAEAFESCLATAKFKPSVEADFQAGVKASVNGTPAFFINGIPVSGAQPASVFEQAIDAELARLGQQRASH